MGLSFRKTLVLWFALAIAIMLGVAASVYSSFKQTIALDAWVVHTRDVMDLLDAISVAERDIESGSRGYAFTGDVSFFQAYSVGAARIGQLAQKLEKTVEDNPPQMMRARRLRADLLERIGASANLIALFDKTGSAQARHSIVDAIVDGHSLSVTAEIRVLLSEMRDEEERLLIVRTKQVATARSRALVMGATGVLLSLVIIGLVFALVRREGIRRLDAEAQLSAANNRLSSGLQRAERQIQEKHMIDRVAGLLHSCSTVEDASEIIGKEVRQALPDLRGVVYLFRASRNLVEAMAHWNEPHALRAGKSFPPEECWALKSGLQHVMRTQEDVACGHVDNKTTEATVCVPMNIHGQSIGLVHVEGTADQFDEDRLDLVRRLVDQIGMSLATLRLQERLRDQSFHDPLTGLFNRRYLETALEKEMSRADRHRQTIGIIMIDIDHFKSINDRYGHEGGDLVLKNVSDTLRRHTRTEDIACRYGGEEFLLAFPGASMTATGERAETLRKAVENLTTVLSDGKFVTATTISLGVAVYPTLGLDWRGVIQIADQALYRAKDEGRNRVVLANTGAVATTQVTGIETTGS